LTITNNGNLNWGSSSAFSDIIISKFTTKQLLIDNLTHDVTVVSKGLIYIESDNAIGN
jgi:hypothetical protein